MKDLFFESLHTLLSTIIFLLIAYMPVDAQNNIVRGHIYLQNSKEPLAYATVRNATSKAITYSDSLGYYEIKAQHADSLVYSYIGCLDQIFHVTNQSQHDVYLNDQALSLGEVEIRARKRPIQLLHNGLLVRMDAIKKDGKILSDILPQIPTLHLKNNTITMAGKDIVLVYLNHHQLYIKGSDLLEYLNSLGLDNIESIQVISNPPAKYEAEGNIGILKIITKRSVNPGWQTRLLGKISAAHDLSAGGSANIIYSNQKLTIGNIILGSHSNNFTHSRYSNYFENEVISTNNPRKNKITNVMMLTNFNYVFDHKNNLSATLQIPWYDKDKNHDIENITRYQSLNNTVTDSIMSSLGQGYSGNHQFNGEMNYAHSFNDHSDINVTAGYINNYIKNYRGWRSMTYNPLLTEDETYFSRGHQNYDIFTFKIDGKNQYKKIDFTEGYKFSYTNSTSFNENNETLSPNAIPQNTFGYRETSHALYLNSSFSYKALSVDLGLRGELTYTKGISYTYQQTHTNHYFRCFPSIDMRYVINDNNVINVNYSGRIKRPDYHLLDPFRWYSSKYDYSEGNPFLKPSNIHLASLTYMYKDLLFTRIYSSNTTNDFGKMVILDADHIQNQIERADNYLDIYQFGINSELNLQIGTAIESKLSNDITYTNYSSKAAQFKSIKGWGVNFTLDNTIAINKKLSASIYMEDNLPGYYNYRKFRNSFLLNIGLHYTNKKKDMTIRLQAEDILKSSTPKYSYYSNGINQIFDNYNDERQINLTVIKKLGNFFNKTKGRFETSNAEEKERL
jgi:hypothetical protein